MAGAEEREEEPEVDPEPGSISALDPLTTPLPREGEEGDHSSVHSCDTEGYYTTFHDFDGFQVYERGSSCGRIKSQRLALRGGDIKKEECKEKGRKKKNKEKMEVKLIK